MMNKTINPIAQAAEAQRALVSISEAKKSFTIFVVGIRYFGSNVVTVTYCLKQSKPISSSTLIRYYEFKKK